MGVMAVTPGNPSGTWTPVDASGAGLVFTSAVGRWTLVGNTVIATASVVYPTTADASVPSIGPLPFPVAANKAAQQGFFSFIASGASAKFPSPVQNSTNVRFLNSAGGNITNANMSGLEVDFTVIYNIN